MSSSTNSIPSPLSIRMNTPDPLMDPELATLLCTTLALCPGHMRGYTSQGFCSLEDIANTTMNTLHHLSLQHDHIDPYFPHHPQFSTADFFSELLLLLLLQWATYHNRPLSDFNIDILDDLEVNGTDSELRLHFEKLLHYSSESTTTTTPTIRDLHPTSLSPHNSHSQHTSTTTSTPIYNIQEYLSDDDTPTASTKPPVTPKVLPLITTTTNTQSTPISIINTINDHAINPTKNNSNDSHPTAATPDAYDHGFDEGYTVGYSEANQDHYDNDFECNGDSSHDNYGYDSDNDGYGYEDDIEPEPPPHW